MNYKIQINGIDVDATFSEDNIQEIFLPLLRNLSTLQQNKGRRILVMLAAAPGVGKSTLCNFLQHLSETTEDIHPIQVIGMDGFHRYQDYLITHTAMRDGQEILMVKIKGAPVTFDLPLLEERIRKVASGENCGWPTYNRMTHNPQEDAITVTGDIVLLEGNYLLLDCDGWENLKKYADYTIRISAEPAKIRPRLIARKSATGVSAEEAAAFVDSSDLYNAGICLKHSVPGDLNLRLLEDDSYAVIPDAWKDWMKGHSASSEPDIPDCGCIYG